MPQHIQSGKLGPQAADPGGQTFGSRFQSVEEQAPRLADISLLERLPKRFHTFRPLGRATDTIHGSRCQPRRRANDHEMDISRGCDRLDPLAAASANGRPLCEEQGHITA
jgi:hypothetical protein